MCAHIFSVYIYRKVFLSTFSRKTDELPLVHLVLGGESQKSAEGCVLRGNFRMPRVIHSEIDPVLSTVAAENHFLPTVLSAATSPTSPPHPRAKGTRAPYPHLPSRDLPQCWHLAVEERNLELWVYTSRLLFLRELQTTFLPGQAPVPTHPPHSCHHQDPSAPPQGATC